MGDRMRLSDTLRLMTYLSPDIPINMFEMMRDYLEDKTGAKACLITESRWKGPPADRVDPFTNDDADMVFLTSSSFLEQKEKKNKFMELCKAAPLHTKARNNDEPVCFSEVVVLKNKVASGAYKDFEGIRGGQWAYSHRDSLTGCVAMMSELKKRGNSANFFAGTFETGSHLASLEMVLGGQADVATVDSVVLEAFKADNPEKAEQLSVIASLGPLPIYTIAFNTRLSAELKDKITKALLNLASENSDKWIPRFLAIGMKGFTPITEDNFVSEVELIENVKGMSLKPAYY